MKQSIDVGKILRFYLRYWYLFAAAVIIAVVIAYGYNRYQTPVYSLNTKLLIEDKTTNILLPDGTTSIFNSKAIDNEIAKLKSFSSIKSIIDQLEFQVSYFSKGEITSREIYKSSPFRVEYDSGVRQPWDKPITIRFTSNQEFILKSDDGSFNGTEVYRLDETIKGAGYQFRISLTEKTTSKDQTGHEYSFIINSTDRLVSMYRNKTSIGLDRGSSILTVSTSGTNVEKEKDFLNKLTEVYIQTNLEQKNQIASNTIVFIDGQLEQLKTQLDDVEQQMEDFRKSNKLMRLSDRAVPILQRVNTLDRNKADQALDLKYYKYLQDYLLTHDKFDDIVAPSTVGISLPLFSDLLLKLSTTYLEKEDLLVNSSKDNPYIKTLETEIVNQKKVLLENITNVIHISEMKIEDFDRQIKELLEEFETLPQLERMYIEIERFNKLNSDMYTYLLQKRAEAQIARANTTADMILIDKAGDNGVRKISPNTRSNYSRAIIFGLLLPSVILFIVFLLNKTISDIQELQSVTTLPIMAVLPHHRYKAEMIADQYPSAPFTQAIRRIRSRLGLGMAGAGRVVAVTSTVHGEGKSLLAINLALACAIAGKKTLLTSIDVHRPGFEKLGIPAESKGLFDFLLDQRGSDAFLRIPVRELHPNLDVLMPGQASDPVDAMVNDPLLDEIIQRLRVQYDILILDTPPAGITSEVYDLARSVDDFLYLVRVRVAPRSLLKDTLEYAGTVPQIKNLSLILNDVRSSSVLLPG